MASKASSQADNCWPTFSWSAPNLAKKSFLYGHACMANLKIGLIKMPWYCDNVLPYASVKVFVNSADGKSTVSLMAWAVNCKPRLNHNKPWVAFLFLVPASDNTKSCKVEELAGSSNNLALILVILPVISFWTTEKAEEPNKSNNLTKDSEASFQEASSVDLVVSNRHVHEGLFHFVEESRHCQQSPIVEPEDAKEKEFNAKRDKETDAVVRSLNFT